MKVVIVLFALFAASLAAPITKRDNNFSFLSYYFTIFYHFPFEKNPNQRTSNQTSVSKPEREDVENIKNQLEDYNELQDIDASEDHFDEGDEDEAEDMELAIPDDDEFQIFNDIDEDPEEEAEEVLNNNSRVPEQEFDKEESKEKSDKIEVIPPMDSDEIEDIAIKNESYEND
ncbi:putative pre-rRNA-processing protein esf2 [Hydractinia symbiolongicarpus]|uniref:putative pre-rRNA-processing protein esf2 n=1 Tax=Hydractinia symbiolongicarpus TaxID=13093 RepID=UPI00254D6EED|nr:putative pre-rRNA-processing protein esf2 [Hydractinia symbiolongicarpus]